MSISEKSVEKSKEDIRNAISELLKELDQSVLEAESLKSPYHQMLKNIRVEAIRKCTVIQESLENLG